jgi:hypothetical protein
LTYGFLSFVVFGRQVKSFKWPSLYQYFWNTWWSIWIFKKTEKWVPAPVVFLVCHFIYIAVAHLFALGSYFSAASNLGWLFVAITMVINTGANFYSHQFSKDFKAQLKNLSMLEKEFASQN